jgi:hypothetical protein
MSSNLIQATAVTTDLLKRKRNFKLSTDTLFLSNAHVLKVMYMVKFVYERYG